MFGKSQARQDPRGQRVAEQFRGALGADCVASDSSVWRYACAGAVPHCVVAPGSVEEIRAAVRLAAANRLRIVPCGNATHLHIGSPPHGYDAALSIRRLDRVLAHEAGDMTVTVEAGVTLKSLNTRLAAAGQWLPCDAVHGHAMTVGGLVAADRNGPGQLSYGKVRDMLLGMRVVTADAEIVTGGGRVVKNVAGYDLPKLFTGSYGTLGVIVEASFRLWPRPPAQALLLSPAPSLEEALARGLAVLESGTTPSLLTALNVHAGETIGTGSAALLVKYEGTESGVRGQMERVEALVPELQAVDEREAQALHEALVAFPQPMNEDVLVARASLLPTRLPPVLRGFESEAQNRGLTLEIAAHIGSGTAWCQLAGPVSPLEFELCAEWMRVQVRAAQGWLVFESLPEGLQGRLDPWGFSGSALPLMRRIKTALDPDGLFSPGRFVGGI